MCQPEPVSPPETLPPPETMCQPEPVSPPETLSQPNPVEIMDALDAELEEAEELKGKEKESLELEKREKVIEKKDKIEEVEEIKEKFKDLNKKKKMKQREKAVDVGSIRPPTAHQTQRGLDSIDEHRLCKEFPQFIRAKWNSLKKPLRNLFPKNAEIEAMEK
ncbi:hypothetical protein Q7C36_004465 [Tachysurus vachellii]|uniref:Uncharacterized protein n=1 Tax=Tachysurus vachellii TaxID=175792 RepID=A0AA88TB05_TACVA|nr:hypothetical protein Q7C36_004465 [Tachysurus vachellii]